MKKELDIMQKAAHLDELKQYNFTNRVLGETCHFHELAKDPKTHHYIIDNYDKISKELIESPHKPSPALATLATSGVFSNGDVWIIIKRSQGVSAPELKEFFELREQHTGSGLRMIDYLCFPVVVQMTAHLPSEEKIDLMMIKPELMSDKIYMYPTLKSLSNKERATLMEKATPEQKENLTQQIERADNPHEFAFATLPDFSSATIWLVCVEAQSRFKDIRLARQAATPEKVAHQHTSLPNPEKVLQKN